MTTQTQEAPMTTYTIKTDAGQQNIEATSFDTAAQAEGATDAISFLTAVAAVDGAWAWIECGESGERMGGSTPAALREWLSSSTDDVLRTAQIYWDTQDPNNVGWAYRIENEDSGALDATDADDLLAAARELAAYDPSLDRINVFRNEQLALVYRGEKDWRFV